MKREVILLSVFFFAIGGVLAQFDKVGTTWHYLVRQSNSDTSYGHKIEAIKDTVFKSKQALVLEGLSSWLPSDTLINVPEYCYLATEGNKTYLYDFNRDTYSLIIDKGWNVGDTFLFQWGAKLDSFVITVANQSNPLPNISDFQIQHIEQGQLGWGSNILYPAGYSNAFIPKKQVGIPEDELSYLQCFDDQNGVSFNISAYGCDTKFTVGIESPNEIQIELYPNPIKNHFSIVSEVLFLKVELLTMSGELVNISYNEETGNCKVPELAQGIYTLILYDENYSKYFKKIVAY